MMALNKILTQSFSTKKGEQIAPPFQDILRLLH